MSSVPDRVDGVESLEVLSRFREDFHGCLTRRAEAMFELAEAVLCVDGPVQTLVGLSLAPEHRGGHRVRWCLGPGGTAAGVVLAGAAGRLRPGDQRWPGLGWGLGSGRR